MGSPCTLGNCPVIFFTKGISFGSNGRMLTTIFPKKFLVRIHSILVLYIVSSQDAVNPGLGWSNLEALKFYGWYTALVYFACIPGGIISDRLIGKKKSVLYGGFLLCIGHLILAISQIFFFFTGILLIIIGVGLLKPNISSLVGNLYKKSDKKRDQGFTIFYIGINIGAFLSSLIVGFIGEKYGWH